MKLSVDHLDPAGNHYHELMQGLKVSF